MGTCTAALLSWGIVIPEDKLVALLHAFRKHKQGQDGPREATDHVDGPSAKKLKTGATKKTRTLRPGEDEELVEYVEDVMESGFTAFIQFVKSEESTGTVSLAFYYQDGYVEETDEDVQRTYKVDRWGSENYGEACLPLGPKLTTEHMSKGMEGKMEELKAALHLKDADIDVEEQWILTASIG